MFVLVSGVAIATHAQVTTTTSPAAATTSPATSGEARLNETRVPLAEQAVALDNNGQSALAGRLRTTTLTGTPDAPGRNSRIVLENRGTAFYTYVSGWATFYDAEGIRCGEGLWKAEAFAPGESVEVDTPGLRLACAPVFWRIVATNLVTRAGDTARPPAGDTAPATPVPSTPSTASPAPATAPTVPTIAVAQQTTTAPTGATSNARTSALPPLEININGKTLPLQPGNPLEIIVGRERVRIVVNTAP